MSCIKIVFLFRIQSTASQSLLNDPIIFYENTDSTKRRFHETTKRMRFGWDTVYLTESMIIGRRTIQLQYRTQKSRHDSFDMKAQYQLVSGRPL